MAGSTITASSRPRTGAFSSPLTFAGDGANLSGHTVIADVAKGDTIVIPSGTVIGDSEIAALKKAKLEGTEIPLRPFASINADRVTHESAEVEGVTYLFR